MDAWPDWFRTFEMYRYSDLNQWTYGDICRFLEIGLSDKDRKIYFDLPHDSRGNRRNLKDAQTQRHSGIWRC